MTTKIKVKAREWGRAVFTITTKRMTGIAIASANATMG
jgi:hypothetical protein